MEHPADALYYAELDKAERRESAVSRAADEIYAALMRGEEIAALWFASQHGLAILRPVVTIEPADMAEHLSVATLMQARAAANAGCASEAARLLTAALSDAANHVAEDYAENRADYLEREGDMERAVARAEYMEDR